METKKEIQIIKWNFYNAKMKFLEIPGSKNRPVIAVAKMGIAVFVIPLTTNLSSKTDFDIKIKLNSKDGLIKVGNLQRININDIKSPFYSIHNGNQKIIRANKPLQKAIKEQIFKLFISS